MSTTIDAPARRITRAEYQALPQGPPYYELISGKLIETSPRPFRPHSRLEIRLAHLLGSFVDELGGELVRKPNLYLPGTQDVYHPDLLYLAPEPRGLHRVNGVHGSPFMVCEILSYSTERIDRDHKPRTYERAGVRHYRLFDPSRAVKVEELVLDEKGRYREQAFVAAPDVWSPVAFPRWKLDLGALEARIYPPDDPDADETTPGP